jgi:hypothetical protein
MAPLEVDLRYHGMLATVYQLARSSEKPQIEASDDRQPELTEKAQDREVATRR